MGGDIEKNDEKKIRAGLLIDFSRALEAIAMVSEYGAIKYSEHGWLTIPNAQTRYLNAFWRHLLAMGKEMHDEESGFPHIWHAAWNLLAIIEKELRND